MTLCLQNLVGVTTGIFVAGRGVRGECGAGSEARCVGAVGGQ